jgi:hypothetical protein
MTKNPKKMSFQTMKKNHQRPKEYRRLKPLKTGGCRSLQKLPSERL